MSVGARGKSNDKRKKKEKKKEPLEIENGAPAPAPEEVPAVNPRTRKRRRLDFSDVRVGDKVSVKVRFRGLSRLARRLHRNVLP